MHRRIDWTWPTVVKCNSITFFFEKNVRPGHHRPGPTSTNLVTRFGQWAVRHSCLGSYVASAAAQPLHSWGRRGLFLFLFLKKINIGSPSDQTTYIKKKFLPVAQPTRPLVNNASYKTATKFWVKHNNN